MQLHNNQSKQVPETNTEATVEEDG